MLRASASHGRLQTTLLAECALQLCCMQAVLHALMPPMCCMSLGLQVRREVHHVHARLPLRCVALGDSYTHVISYENGDMAWSSGLSDGLYEAVNTTRRYKKEIATVALGRNQGSSSYSKAADPGEVWFMMRDTGTTYMGSACEDDLRDAWDEQEDSERVERVAFAPNGGWYLDTEGGGANWSGLPDSLEEALDELWDAEGGVEHLSVGHNGEWFVLFESGAYLWQGVHPTLDRLLSKQEVGGCTCNIEWVELGPGGTFVALCDKHTGWYGSRTLTDHLLACQ